MSQHNAAVVLVKARVRPSGEREPESAVCAFWGGVDEAALVAGGERKADDTVGAIGRAVVDHQHFLAAGEPDERTGKRVQTADLGELALSATKRGHEINAIVSAVAPTECNLGAVGRPCRWAEETALVVGEAKRCGRANQLYVQVVVLALRTVPDEGDLPRVRREDGGDGVARGRGDGDNAQRLRGLVAIRCASQAMTSEEDDGSDCDNEQAESGGGIREEMRAAGRFGREGRDIVAMDR